MLKEHNDVEVIANESGVSQDTGASEVHTLGVDNHCRSDIAGVVSELVALQKQRRFCIVTQSRCDRSIESFIAGLIGMGPMTPENATQAEKLAAQKVRKTVFAQASAVRKAVERGGEVLQHHKENLDVVDLSPAYPLIRLSAQSRHNADMLRAEYEARMKKLAKGLPMAGFVGQVKGFGFLGLAIIIAECGNLSNYVTKMRLWKRLGITEIDGERQQRKAGAEMALRHGYNPQRRAEVWTIVDSLFKHQWNAGKDGAEGKPAGIYGEVYAARKVHTMTTHPEWTPAHRENDARRIMGKRLIKHVWQAWKKMELDNVR